MNEVFYYVKEHQNSELRDYIKKHGITEKEEIDEKYGYILDHAINMNNFEAFDLLIDHCKPNNTQLIKMLEKVSIRGHLDFALKIIRSMNKQ